MKKILIIALGYICINGGFLFANSHLQMQANTLVELLVEHKQLDDQEAIDYRENRLTIIQTVAETRTDIVILPYLVDAIQTHMQALHTITQWNQEREELLQLINRLRNGLGLSSLVYDPDLDRAAQQYAEYMYNNNHFAHQSLDGTNVADRVQEVGYTFSLVGENLARGFTGHMDVLGGRYASPTHRANFVHPGFVHMGLGRTQSYRAQIFARPK